MIERPPDTPVCPPEMPQSRPARLAVPALILLLGVMLIALAAVVEDRTLSQYPWRYAVVCPAGALPWDEAQPLRARRIPKSNLPPDSPFMAQLRQDPGGEDLIESFGLDRMEYVFMLYSPPEAQEALLGSGRLPEPGKPEVLAGNLARFDTFEMDGTTFTVTGRIRPGTSAVQSAYLLFEHETAETLFTKEAGGTLGWYDPDGMKTLADDELSELAPPAELFGGGGRSPASSAALAMMGLMLVAAGGALFQVRLLRIIARRHKGLLAPILREVVQRPVLLWSMHGLCYGTFFLCMGAAFAYPGLGLRLSQFTQHALTEGDLGYIGQAYESGNILKATAATFAHNYGMATCLFSILPSLAIPFAGLLKNLASFSLVGFVMSPMWAGSAASYTYHCITLTLELEAYIIVSFMASVLPLRVVQGMQNGTLIKEYAAGVRSIGSGTLLVGIMLAIAALYEATTIILFSG